MEATYSVIRQVKPGQGPLGGDFRCAADNLTLQEARNLVKYLLKYDLATRHAIILQGNGDLTRFVEEHNA